MARMLGGEKELIKQAEKEAEVILPVRISVDRSWIQIT